jgi:hypothetical protein
VKLLTNSENPSSKPRKSEEAILTLNTFIGCVPDPNPDPDPYVLGLPDPHLDLLVTSPDPDPPFTHKSVEWIEIKQIFSC